MNSSLNRVPITQFHTPNGRQSDSWCEVTPEVFAKFEAIMKHPLRVTAEILTTGQVSLCLEHARYGDFDCRICANGSGDNSPPAVLAKMINDFNEPDFLRWLESEESR